jgi:hypothetical protein
MKRKQSSIQEDDVTKAFLITIRIHDGAHDYDEYPIVFAESPEEARQLVWAYLQCGYYQDTDPGEWTIENEDTHTIEEAYGDRLFSIHDIKEIPAEHSKVLTEYMAWDATGDAKRAVKLLKEQE